MRDKNKKPIPLHLRDASPRHLCPVCGTVSYSRQGIHPQCAKEQADAPRKERVKRNKKADGSNGKAATSLALGLCHKRCPRCQAQLHIRKMTCGCGYQFDKKT